MSFVSDLLDEPERRWQRFPLATSAEIDELENSFEFDFPEQFLDLLRYSNGGEGDIALPPLVFCLDSISEIITMKRNQFYQREFPGFLFFGGNGGGELLAFDVRKKRFPIVMVDPIGGKDSTIQIASSFDEFINAVGLEYKDA